MGWTSTEIGILGSVAGACLASLQMLVYPPLARRLTHIRLLQIAYLLGVPYFFLYPTIHLTAAKDKVTVMVIMCVYMLPKVWIHVVGFTATVLCVNNSAKAHLRGAINGLAQSVASAVRAIGPVLGGIVWSWSVTMNFTYHAYVPFFLLTICCLLALCVACYLPSSLTKPREIIIMKEHEETSDS